MANILIIDDEANILKLTSFLIKSLGHTPFVASSGKEALQFLKEGITIDLILTDLIMPEVNGFEVCQSVGDKFPIVIVSAMCNELKPDIPFTTQAIDYIAKPFDINYLQKRIPLYLNKYKKNPHFQPEPAIKINSVQFYKGENVLVIGKNFKFEKKSLPTLTIDKPEDFFLSNILSQSEILGQNIQTKAGGLRIIKNINLEKNFSLIKSLNQTNFAFGDITGIFLTAQAPSDIMLPLFDRHLEI